MRALLLWLAMGCGPRVGPAPAVSARDLGGDPGLRGEVVSRGDVSDRLAQPDAAEVVLFYGSEEGGSLEPCGCDAQPRGGLARAATYMDAVRAADPGRPTVFVNAGQWLDDSAMLDGRLRPDATERNRWMVAGLQQVGLDAANASIRDLPALSALGAPPDLDIVSAHLQGDGIDAARRIDAGGLTIAITGVSSPGPALHEVPGFVLGHPVQDSRATLRSLRESADLVVLLTYADPKAARTLAREGLVDVVIDAFEHSAQYAPIRVGDAIWVRSHAGTERLGELRLWREEGVWQAVDRKVELDDGVPARDDEAALAGAARDAIQAVEQAAFGALPKR